MIAPAAVYLDASDRLSSNATGVGTGGNVRGRVWLLRIALEFALDGYWRRVCPPVVACRSRRAQFLLLRRYSGAVTAHRVRSTWTELSRVGHHHCFDLAPSMGELTALTQEVTLLLELLTITDDSSEQTATA
jgi:hypothetical protein